MSFNDTAVQMRKRQEAGYTAPEDRWSCSRCSKSTMHGSNAYCYPNRMYVSKYGICPKFKPVQRLQHATSSTLHPSHPAGGQANPPSFSYSVGTHTPALESQDAAVSPRN